MAIIIPLNECVSVTPARIRCFSFNSTSEFQHSNRRIFAIALPCTHSAHSIVMGCGCGVCVPVHYSYASLTKSTLFRRSVQATACECLFSRLFTVSRITFLWCLVSGRFAVAFASVVCLLCARCALCVMHPLCVYSAYSLLGAVLCYG